MRNIVELIPARPTSDGAGVKLKRVFGGRGLERFDPFLMLDEFGSDESAGDKTGDWVLIAEPTQDTDTSVKGSPSTIRLLPM